MPFKDDDIAPPKSQFASNSQPHDAGTDNQDIYCVTHRFLPPKRQYV